MSATDWYVGAYRDLGGRLMRGEPLSNYFTYWNGWEEGNVNPTAERTLPTSVVVGAQMLHAVGIGYAIKYRGEQDTAVVTFFGDGATSEGDYHEAMNYASVWQTPVVFVCQNNHYAISIPRAKQTRSATLAQKAIAYEMPGVQVDGNDVLAVYQATKEALDRAKSGQGPSFIEALTYRLMHHTTADDPTKYRLDEEEKEWWKKDPLPRFRAYLEQKGYWNEQAQVDVEAAVQSEVEHAVLDFESRNSFRPDAPFDHVFGTRHAELERQRADFLANLQREEGAAGHV
jgi:pyruvate dehydrogenase E1 component alpha subunit